MKDINKLEYKKSWIAYLKPYTNLRITSEDKISISLDQINGNNYNGKLFSKLITKIPLSNSNTYALVSYDGGFMIPQNEEFPSPEVVSEKFNEVFTCLFLADFEANIVYPRDIAIGYLDDLTFFSYTPSFHSNVHNNWLGIVDRIQLLNARILSTEELKRHYSYGQMILSVIDNFTPYFYLNGNTALIQSNYNDALINLWTTVEQLTAFLMKHFKITFKPKYEDTVCSHHKKLHAQNIIPTNLFDDLNSIRKKRNDVIHKGHHSTEHIGIMLQKTIKKLINICLSSQSYN